MTKVDTTHALYLHGFVGTHRMRPHENGFVMADTRSVSLQGYSLRNDFTGFTVTAR